MNNNNNKWMFLSASTLKIIAMILMVIDHIGYQFYRQLGEYYEVFRIFGRLSLPIFAYLITDGMIHSRNKIKYILQMLILGIGIELVDQMFIHTNQGNIMTTLGLSALSIYFLQKDKWYEKLLSILPLVLVILGDPYLEITNIKVQYGIYGFITVLGFYLSYLISSKINLKNKILIRNIISSLFLIIFNLLWMLIAGKTNFWDSYAISFQIYAIFASILIIFYSGKRGYNKQWFKWFCYLFYPLQFILIYLAYMLI